MIKAKYGIPHKYSDGGYDVFIMDFGDGYRIDRGTDEDSDLLCFDEMPVAARCIEKKAASLDRLEPEFRAVLSIAIRGHLTPDRRGTWNGCLQ
ncbi:hypothetical protein DK872_04440 [Kosakonia sp. MH5]|nr:hypothetical protein [Kosakonia sp. MH5]